MENCDVVSRKSLRFPLNFPVMYNILCAHVQSPGIFCTHCKFQHTVMQQHNTSFNLRNGHHRAVDPRFSSGSLASRRPALWHFYITSRACIFYNELAVAHAVSVAGELERRKRNWWRKVFLTLVLVLPSRVLERRLDGRASKSNFPTLSEMILKRFANIVDMMYEKWRLYRSDLSSCII